MNRSERRRAERELKRQKSMIPNSASRDKEFVRKIEEGFMAMGEMKGITYMEELYKNRFIKEVPKVSGIGPKRFVKLAKALGISGITEKEYKS
jgi:DNA polymerase/3'-5' exonuclease PolX